MTISILLFRFQSNYRFKALKPHLYNKIFIFHKFDSKKTFLNLACGDNSNCVARNNRAYCSCPEHFLGDARTRCYTECTRHDECSDNQACVKFKCKDPCREPDPNVCGSGANCEVKNHKPICSCPRGMFESEIILISYFFIKMLPHLEF